jgi:hypothetical protein
MDMSIAGLNANCRTSKLGAVLCCGGVRGGRGAGLRGARGMALRSLPSLPSLLIDAAAGSAGGTTGGISKGTIAGPAGGTASDGAWSSLEPVSTPPTAPSFLRAIFAAEESPSI